MSGDEISAKEEIKARSDLKNAGILVGGQLAISDIEELNEALAAQILDDGYSEFWDVVHSDQPCYSIFKTIVGENLSDSTVKWRLRRVTALAKNLGVISKKRIKY